jgi:hypothetical protein
MLVQGLWEVVLRKPGPKSEKLLTHCDKTRIKTLVDSVAELLPDQYEGEVLIALSGVLAGVIKESHPSRREMLREVALEILETIAPTEAQKENGQCDE